MSEDVYRRLAAHLDDLPGGYPPTPTGVELRILKRLFTPEDAELALHLTVIPEEARVIARRAGIPPEEASRRLADMARKGLVFAIHRKGREPLYMAAQFVIGIWEYHVDDLDPDLVRDVNEYIPYLFDPEVWRKAPQLRTVPVGRSIPVEHAVMDYERAEHLVRSQKRILVAPCICRREHRMAGKGCDAPEETCLIFGVAATYYEQRGVGRVISADEAVGILRLAEDAGLVLQPSNSQRAVNICCCCGCCCQVLKCIARAPRPSEVVSSPFRAVLDADACVGCGRCEERCQMGALEIVEAAARLDPDRCIGCGLCVPTCGPGALRLERRPDAPRVPPTMAHAAYRLARVRGKLGPARLALLALRSKLDRLLALRSI